MLRSAAGMVRTGSLASPDVTAMTSMPLNDKTPKTTAIQAPPKPCGMKPPGSPVKLWKPTGAVHSPKIVAAPRMMKMTIATTLISANQYSMEPKLWTDRELQKSSTAAKPTDHIQTDVPGNENVIEAPAATASAPLAVTAAIQYGE